MVLCVLARHTNIISRINVSPCVSSRRLVNHKVQPTNLMNINHIKTLHVVCFLPNLHFNAPDPFQGGGGQTWPGLTKTRRDAKKILCRKKLQFQVQTFWMKKKKEINDRKQRNNKEIWFWQLQWSTTAFFFLSRQIVILVFSALASEPFTKTNNRFWKFQAEADHILIQLIKPGVNVSITSDRLIIPPLYRL